jgi:hypothetical protein
MKPQLDLFNVPKMGPTRREKLDAFKKEHDIAVVGSNKYQWSALLMTHARKRLKGYGVKKSADAWDLIAGYCRLLEETNLIITGPSEIGAIRELCHRNNIPCPL